MINEIPIKIQAASRAVTLKHPNSLDCVVYRKVVLRTNPDGESMGGAPTLGGLAVLSSDDEAEFEYQALGEAKMLITSNFEPSSQSDDGDNVLPPLNADALIECIASPPDFVVKKNDLVAAMPGGGVLIGFEVVDVPSTINIYPYTTKYVISPRDELHDLEPWKG